MAFVSLLIYTLIIYLRPQEIFQALERVELVQYAALATLVLAVTTEPVDVRRLFRRPSVLCLVGFLASVTLSHLSHLYLTAAWESFADFGKTVVLVILIAWVVRTPRRHYLYIWTLLGATAFLAVQGIQQSITGFNWGGVRILLDSHGIDGARILGWGIFNDPNDLALALVFMVPFALGALMGGPVPRNPALGASLLALLIYGIYLTSSRGGIMALVVSMAAMAAPRWGAKVAIPLAGVGAAGLILAGIGRLGTPIPGEASAMDRLWLWSEGLQMLKEAPLFGVGKGMFTDFLPQTAHNSVVLALAETGLVGGFFWIATFYFAARDLLNISALRHAKDAGVRDLAALAGMLLAGMGGFLTAAFFLSRTYLVVLYVPVGLAAACARITADRDVALVAEAPPTPRDWQWIAGLEACTILCIYVLVKVMR